STRSSFSPHAGHLSTQDILSPRVRRRRCRSSASRSPTLNNLARSVVTVEIGPRRQRQRARIAVVRAAGVSGVPCCCRKASSRPASDRSTASRRQSPSRRMPPGISTLAKSIVLSDDRLELRRRRLRYADVALPALVLELEVLDQHRVGIG